MQKNTALLSLFRPPRRKPKKARRVELTETRPAAPQPAQ